jgi:peptidyl-tRNA hydrolase, PTH1 family
MLVVGLGNPGTRYEGTRHNVGFEVADALAETCRSDFQAGKGDYVLARTRWADVPVVIVKPMTYMNDSGDAVRDALEHLAVPPERCLVVCDDFQLPLGTLRLRERGSDGGHNGLYSIIYQLQSEEFPRLRCGIASAHMPSDKSEMAAFVLSPFEPDEQAMVRVMIERARDACTSVLTRGIVPAMNEFNSRPPGEREMPADAPEP